MKYRGLVTRQGGMVASWFFYTTLMVSVLDFPWRCVDWDHSVVSLANLGGHLRLRPTFADALQEKNRTRASFNKTPTNYIS